MVARYLCIRVVGQDRPTISSKPGRVELRDDAVCQGGDQQTVVDLVVKELRDVCIGAES